MPSSKPLLIFDGRCGFCGIWIDYFRKLTGDRVEYAASQEVGEQYPQIPKEQFSKSVQFVRPDGSVESGARAVLATLGLEKLYIFPGLLEWIYRLIAGHRDFFYHLTKWTFGTRIEPLRLAITQWIFVRVLAVIYAIAFGSLSVQVEGLLGANGILPVGEYLKAVLESAPALRFYYVPSIFWINASDAALEVVCYAGIAIAVLVLVGIFERAGLAILFVLYLSLSAVGQDFLSFQWDSLLIETGFLAIFLGPSRIVVWLYRWLLYRLMFMSGAVKLLSHDPTWRGFTALSYHYWTQPLPNRISWYMAQLPLSFQKVSTAWTLVVELAIPFLIFAPRRLRIFAAWCLLVLQTLIFLTGNYTFFNLLAVGLCLFLFDDRDFDWLRRRPAQKAVRYRWAYAVLAVMIVAIGMARMYETFSGQAVAIVKYTAPFQLVNSYGLFAAMTVERPEIIIEGSIDGETWVPYSFRYKAGDPARAPGWIEPFQPRLDWQMWFAALGNYRENAWFVNFVVRLLQGSPEVKGLLAADPFGGKSPRYVRALLYDYSFTDFQERRKTGNWWRRSEKGLYLPAIGLKAVSQYP